MHCRNCGKEIDSKAVVCVHCGVPPRAEKRFCNNCGVSTNSNQTICISCGVNLANPGKKSKSSVLLLGLLFGTVGAHKFYMGSWGWGIIYVILALTVFLIWIPIFISIIEVIRIIIMSDDEFQQKAREFEDKGPFAFFW